MIKACTSAINDHSWIYVWEYDFNRGGAIFLHNDNNYVKQGSIIELTSMTISVLEKEFNNRLLSLSEVILKMPPVKTFHSTDIYHVENFKYLLKKLFTNA